MNIIGKLVAANGSYTNQEGEEKNRWVTVGKLMQREDGTYTAKIDAVPVGQDWTGWLSVFEDNEPKKRTKKPHPQTADPDDDIPF